MSTVTVTRADGATLSMDDGSTGEDVAYESGPGLGSDTVAGVVDGELVDKHTPLTEDVELVIVTPSSDEYVDVLGSASTQQVTRVNDAAWRSFFETVEEIEQAVSPPGSWGNQAAGRDLPTYIRNDPYPITWRDRSRL